MLSFSPVVFRCLRAGTRRELISWVGFLSSECVRERTVTKDNVGKWWRMHTPAVRAGTSRNHLGICRWLGQGVVDGVAYRHLRGAVGCREEAEQQQQWRRRKIPVRSPPGLGRYSERSSRQLPRGLPKPSLRAGVAHRSSLPKPAGFFNK